MTLTTPGLRRRKSLIAGISSYIGVRKVLKNEPFDIFRG
jgi:hypothetical protein